MKFKCSACDSDDIDVVACLPQKSRVKPDKSGFTPTSSDFGIFYNLGKCRKCGMVFALPDIEDIGEDRLYLESKDSLYLSQVTERTRIYKKILSHLKNFIPVNSRLLDIGCSYGFFLKLAKDAGLEAYGVEVSRDACQHCRDILGLSVSCGDIKQADFPADYFDVVTAIELIEHIRDIRGFIDAVRRVLKPGGILYLVTPDIQSLSARLLGCRWWSYRRMHLNYFSKNTLYEFLNSNGFSIISNGAYKKTFKISYILYQLYRSGCNKMAYYSLLGLSNIFRVKEAMINMSFGDIAVTAKKV